MTRPRELRWLLLAICAAPLIWFAGSGLATFLLLHRVLPARPEPLPAELAGRARDVRLQTADGESLGAWYAPGDAQKPLVILLHGHWEKRSNELPRLRLLLDDGEGALAVTARAHGDSSGTRCDVGYGGVEDVRAAVAFAEINAPGRPLVVFGASMGAASALFAAKSLGNRVRGYILDSPYVDLAHATAGRLHRFLPPPLDALALVTMRPWFRWLDGVSLDEVSPVEHFADIPADVPILLMRGAHDRTISASDFAALASAAGARAKVVEFPNAGHIDAPVKDVEAYRDTVLAMLHRIGQP